MKTANLAVPADQLRYRCDPDSLGFSTTDEVPPLEGMIGQERALSALELALDITEPGFNLFISGPPGSGRSTALRGHLELLSIHKPIPPDWGYVHNFQDPSQPVPISLPCGWMRELAADMQEMVDTIRREVPGVFESDDYTQRMETAVQDLRARRQDAMTAMNKAAAEAGFFLGSSPAGITPVPMRDGQPLTPEAYAALPETERVQFQQCAEELQQSISRTLADIRQLGKAAAEEAREVDTEIVRFTLTPIVDELQQKYGAFPEVAAHLERVQEDLVENLDLLKPSETSSGSSTSPATDQEAFVRYQVNDLVDNTSCESAPVVFENNPTYYNLFGRIDYVARMGTLNTNHTMVKAGAIHQANGGYLILQARDLLASPLAWQTLKRTLQSGETRIENMGDQLSQVPSATLRPKPIPVNAKVIVIGTPDVLAMLQTVDEDFGRFFKVIAQFDTQMDRTPENIVKYASFVAARCQREHGRSFDKSAVASIIEYSSRLAEHQEKLTTRFLEVSDIITEAKYWATSAQDSLVTDAHVTKAIEQRRFRASLMEDRIQELIEDGTIRISTDGEKVGQVNGLAILASRESSFGKPSRITARVSLGQGQLVNVERETKLSGRIHDKGFLALTGYLRGKYGLDKPLSLNASISFEQSYSEVDGDSASSTELYALLSAISRLPLAQGIGVTGSVNQNGDVQAIGGATQKIEGFYEVCKAQGLTGRQGVMVPRDNLKHINLNDEVVEAVKAGQFQVYAIASVDEGIETLTGVPAGVKQEDGEYPEGTVHYLVELRLREMAQAARKFASAGSASQNRDALPDG